MSATEGDRETATRLVLHTGAEPYELAIEWIAAALAAEREKARAPFRKMALDVKDGWQPSADRLADAILAYTGGL